MTGKQSSDVGTALAMLESVREGLAADSLRQNSNKARLYVEIGALEAAIAALETV